MTVLKLLVATLRDRTVKKNYIGSYITVALLLSGAFALWWSAASGAF